MKYIAVLFGVLGLDWATKAWVQKALPLGIRKKIGKKHLYFYHIKNTGLAYHKCAGEQKKILMLTGGLTAIYSGMFLKSLVKNKKNSGSPLALAILLGGAFGNFLERWKKGYVTDFLFIKKGNNPPVFNIADLALFLGACTMIFSSKEGKDKIKPIGTIVEKNIL